MLEINQRDTRRDRIAEVSMSLPVWLCERPTDKFVSGVIAHRIATGLVDGFDAFARALQQATEKACQEELTSLLEMHGT